jgi:hypothetical protein
MNQTTVKKVDLIERIKANRAQHREQFLKAQEKYREAVIAELDRRLQEARDGKPIKRGFSLPEPQDYTSSYDEALEMLAWEVGDEVELDRRTFSELVLNDWGWKDHFAANTTSYLAT